ncbi:MAG: amidohydrolase family protein [Burkholderiales bacterium]
MMNAPHRIDVHHHPSPPSYLRLRGEREGAHGPQQSWTVAKSIEDMDKSGVATSVLSLPHAAGLIFSGGNDEARRVVREWNEYMALLSRDYPGRFGVFAALPILDIEGSLAEAAYAFDTLKADGVCLMTNIGDRWLGDPHYAPLFEELNRRHAVVYTHPVASTCCQGILPEFMDALIEYGTDTTRAIAKLLVTGCLARYPNIRFIFSHAGGTLPYLAWRFVMARELKDVEGGVIAALNGLYYDCAQTASPYAMRSFTQLISTSQLLFGTDFPYRTAGLHVEGLAGCGFTQEELHAIDCGNAWRLMPQLRRG